MNTYLVFYIDMTAMGGASDIHALKSDIAYWNKLSIDNIRYFEREKYAKVLSVTKLDN